MVNGAGGPGAVRKRMEMMAGANPEDLADLAAKAKLSWWAKTGKALTTLRYNMMLSSVRTHVANMAGSAFTGAMENLLVNPLKVVNNNAEFVTRALVHKTFGKGGMRTSDRIAMSEIPTLPYDTVSAVRSSFLHAKDVFTGEAMGGGKLYNEMGTRVTDYNPLSVPTNLLEAEDAFFKSIYQQGMIRQLARRQAMKEGVSESDTKQLFEQYVNNPTEEMLTQANEYGKKLTFTNDPSAYGKLLGAVSSSLSTFQQTPMGRLIFPFVQTPMNLVGYAMDNTAVGKLTAPAKFLEDLKNPETRADAAARLQIAAGLYAVVHSYWEEGRITGAEPSNYGEMRVREAAGWRPNAILAPDGNYYELNRVDPLGLMLGTYATAFDVMSASTVPDEYGAGLAAIMTAANLIADRSVLSGLSDVERVFTASENSFGKMSGKWLARMGTSFVIPAIARDVREMVDDKKRAMEVPDDLGGAFTESFAKAFMNAVPGLSDNLPPQVDAFGNNKRNFGGNAYRGLVPVRKGKGVSDPVAIAIMGVNAPVNKPDSKITVFPNAPKVDLLAMDGHRGWVYYSYQKLVGKERYKAIKQLIETPEWQDLVEKDLVHSEAPVAKIVRNLLEEAQEIAKAKFLEAMSGKTYYYPTVEGKQVAGKVELERPITYDMLEEFARQLNERGPTPELRERIHQQGLSYRPRKGAAGLPPELQLKPEKQQGEMPRF